MLIRSLTIRSSYCTYFSCRLLVFLLFSNADNIFFKFSSFFLKMCIFKDLFLTLFVVWYFKNFSVIKGISWASSCWFSTLAQYATSWTSYYWLLSHKNQLLLINRLSGCVPVICCDGCRHIFCSPRLHLLLWLSLTVSTVGVFSMLHTSFKMYSHFFFFFSLWWEPKLKV